MYLNDNLAYNNRLLNMSPRAKILFAMIVLIVSLSCKNYFISIVIFCIITLINIYVSKSSFKSYSRSLFIPLSFLFLSVITLIVSISSGTDGFLSYFSIGSINVGITYSGIHSALRLTIRTMNCISSMYFIILTMPMKQIVEILKVIRLPEIFIEIVVLVYRFIFIFLEECREIYTAQYLRFGYRGIKNSYGSLAILIKCLFLRVMDRYEDLIIVLDTRLYNGKFHV